jgi:hypothetical protein
VVEAKEKTSLNEFLDLYDNDIFEKVDVVNDKKLQ